MKTVTRRAFLVGGATAGAGLVLDRAPARTQKREISFLSVNHFVPTSDDELRRQAEAFGKLTRITVKVDTIMGLQLPAKRAAEAQAHAGHDLVFMSHADPFLFENLLVDLGPLVEAGKAFNMPPLRDLASHPIWAKNPKFAMLPQEGEAAHPRGWPAKPNDAIRRVENNYILPDMVARRRGG